MSLLCCKTMPLPYRTDYTVAVPAVIPGRRVRKG